jgi:hypothetical protein
MTVPAYDRIGIGYSDVRRPDPFNDKSFDATMAIITVQAYQR